MYELKFSQDRISLFSINYIVLSKIEIVVNVSCARQIVKCDFLYLVLLDMDEQNVSKLLFYLNHAQQSKAVVYGRLMQVYILIKMFDRCVLWANVM